MDHFQDWASARGITAWSNTQFKAWSELLLLILNSSGLLGRLIITHSVPVYTYLRGFWFPKLCPKENTIFKFQSFYICYVKWVNTTDGLYIWVSWDSEHQVTYWGLFSEYRAKPRLAPSLPHQPGVLWAQPPPGHNTPPGPPSAELSVLTCWSLADLWGPSCGIEGLRANKRVTFHSVWLVDQFEEHFLGQCSNPNAWVMPWDHIDRDPGNSDLTTAHCNGLCLSDLLPVRKHIFSASPNL